MLGLYDNFPEDIHRTGNFSSSLSIPKLQQRIVRVLHEVNRKPFCFGNINLPSLHGCTVIFEVGIAENKSFNFIDDQEAIKVLKALRNQASQVLDFFVAIRYYKGTAQEKKPLRFDYYMLRSIFSQKNLVELQVFHERGPRYVSPEELINIVEKEVNGISTRKILKKIEPS